MEGRPGHVHQAQGTYDPITNQWLHAPAGTVAQTAGDRSRQNAHDWAVNKTGGACLCAFFLHGSRHPTNPNWGFVPRAKLTTKTGGAYSLLDVLVLACRLASLAQHSSGIPQAYDLGRPLEVMGSAKLQGGCCLLIGVLPNLSLLPWQGSQCIHCA